MAASLKYSVHQYGTHELQRVGIWDLDVRDKAKFWIVYIHGGAWRDPRITHESFAPIITRIVESSHGDGAKPSIAGFASLDYRLSPHPEFPQDRATTPPDRFRGATHPDHIADVRTGIAFLQRRYGFGSRYVLVGHSCGACLAYQVLAGSAVLGSSSSADDTTDPELPKAVFGFEGIYDMTGINARMGGGYSGFLEAAFGAPEKWDAAAPMKCAGSYGDVLTGRVAVLGHSPDDELVDMPETDGMAARLRKDGVTEVLVVKDLTGKHDEIWQDGSGVARTLLRILEILQGKEGKS
ncbi:alpha/beta-hydrolase [Hypomontagnella submonticulosa]|nr:alpha/beta-hydrolase [Hypomontagnella submonticulosa]